MKQSKWVVGMHGVAIGFLAGCGAPLEGDPAGGDELIAEEQSAFKNSLSFPQISWPVQLACSAAQQNTIREFATFLSDRIYENQGNSMRNCLNDSFLSRANGGEWGGDIWTQFNRNVTTSVLCTSNLTQTCANVNDWWGCASIGISGEGVTFSNQFVNDPAISVNEKAGLFAHELNHNYGQRDPNGSETEYGWSVLERARACVRHSNNLPAGESRTNGMPGENELGYIGRFGGTPFELVGNGRQFISGFTVRANATVNSLQVRHTDNLGAHTTSAVVGTQTGVLDSRMCNPDEVIVGISGRAGATVNRLTVRCAPRTNLGAVRDLTPSGNDVGTPYSTMCPAGKAVRYVRGRAGGTIDQIRLVCDDIGRSFSDNHPPHRAANNLAGSANGKLFSLRCSGNGAFSSFDGTVNPSLVRLGGMCRATGSTLPITPGVRHPASNWVGGTGGTAFSNGCNDDELMVGLRVKGGFETSLTAIGPICADADAWDTFAGTAVRTPALSGGGNPTIHIIQCPTFQFLVGLDVYGGGSTVHGLHAVCADMR